LLLIVFLLLSVFIAAGFAIGRRVARARRAEGVEISRRSAQETIQNALGFKTGTLSEAEYPGIRGVFIDSLLTDDAPVAVAKIQAGDIITEVNEQPIQNIAELAKALEPLNAGAEIAVKLHRDGETVASRVRVGDRSVPPLQPRTSSRDQGLMGINGYRRRCCVPGTQKRGVELYGVSDSGPAWLAGLESGDLVTEFDGYPIRTSNEFLRRIKATRPRTRVIVKFYRGGVEQTAELVLGRR
jgi:S1-C subfamily serine protease